VERSVLWAAATCATGMPCKHASTALRRISYVEYSANDQYRSHQTSRCKGNVAYFMDWSIAVLIDAGVVTPQRLELIAQQLGEAPLAWGGGRGVGSLIRLLSPIHLSLPVHVA
jgi:hypothetical protein